MIHRLLSLSTCHITEETNQLLLDRTSDPQHPYAFNGGQTTYGYFLYCEAEPQPDQYPQDLIQVFAHARSLGAEYVYLDRDGDEIDELPQHDW